MFVADMDGDGDLDIVSASKISTIRLPGMRMMEQQIQHGLQLISQLVQMEREMFLLRMWMEMEI